MKKQLLTVLALFLAVFLVAQEVAPVVLVSVQGKLSYTSADNKKPLKVRAGAALKPSGVLKLAKNATAVLFYNEQFVTLAKPGAYTLEKEFNNAGESLGFESEFGNYILACVELATYAKNKGFPWIKSVTNQKTGGDGWGSSVTDPKTSGSGGSGWGSSVTDPKTSGSGGSGWGNSVTDPKTGGSGGSGWGTSVTDPKTGGSGGSGWGTSNSRFTAILPFGRVIASPTTFFWANPSASSSFHFEILDESNQVVFKSDLRDTFLLVNLSTLNLIPGNQYQWKVSAPANKAIDSNGLRFEIGTEEKRAAALKKANSMPVLNSGDDVSLRRVAEAVALEREGWYYSAFETYAEVKRNNPNNLTRMMHAAFLRRYDLTPLAEKAAQK